VKEHTRDYRTGRLCWLLSVSRSGYYRWLTRPRSARDIENEPIEQKIREIYGEGRGEYGTPTVYNVLRELGLIVNRKRVVRLMRQMGLSSKVVKKFKRTTKACKDHQASPNLLEQNFQTDGPNKVWTSRGVIFFECLGTEHCGCAELNYHGEEETSDDSVIQEISHQAPLCRKESEV